MTASALIKVIKILKTNHPDSDHDDLTNQEAYAMKTLKYGGHIFDGKQRVREIEIR